MHRALALRFPQCYGTRGGFAKQIEEAKMSDQVPRHVLDGYKVLDFTQVIAGPTCTL